MMDMLHSVRICARSRLASVSFLTRPRSQMYIASLLPLHTSPSSSRAVALISDVSVRPFSDSCEMHRRMISAIILSSATIAAVFSPTGSK